MLPIGCVRSPVHFHAVQHWSHCATQRCSQSIGACSNAKRHGVPCMDHITRCIRCLHCCCHPGMQIQMEMAVWSQLACVGSAPSPRQGASMAYDGNCLYIFGGWTDKASIRASSAEHAEPPCR